MTKEDYRIGCKEILSKSCSSKEAFSGDREENNAHVERNQKRRNDGKCWIFMTFPFIIGFPIYSYLTSCFVLIV